MIKRTIKDMPYDEIRLQYKLFLRDQELGENSIRTAYADSFYLWRRGGKDVFWTAVEGDDSVARKILFDVLRENTTGQAEKLVNSYLSQIRRFRSFLLNEKGIGLENNISGDGREELERKDLKVESVSIKTPSRAQVEYYLKKWDGLENYKLQEDALDRLFFGLCPNNTNITDILLKVSTLNDFYSTNIFYVYPVAKHILSLNIDARLKAGDVTLVNDIRHVTIKGSERNLYSFASKYCSHHNPYEYPLYDSYVDKLLRFFRDRDGFSSFENKELKDYVCFKGALRDLQRYYQLEEYNLKQIDKYLWLLGKEVFPKKY